MEDESIGPEVRCRCEAGGGGRLELLCIVQLKKKAVSTVTWSVVLPALLRSEGVAETFANIRFNPKRNLPDEGPAWPLRQLQERGTCLSSR